MSSKPLSFQDVIMRLEAYWAAQGCLIWQPWQREGGRGDGQPGTTLRVLGPEPWNVAYVEPIFPARRRPLWRQSQPDADAYPVSGHHQAGPREPAGAVPGQPVRHRSQAGRSTTSVLWKTTGKARRSVRGAWAGKSGWTAWRSRQYTYFQQAGGLTLDPVAVDYTYGLERIAMYLQNVSSVWEIDWDGSAPTAISCCAQEIEYCIYDFEVADVGRLNLMYDLFEAEAKNALAHRLVMPAHDYVLRCSHTFNLLDARGAIGVTERAAYFARMRDLARQVSEAYVEQRQHEEYPWLEDGGGAEEQGSGGEEAQRSGGAEELQAREATEPAVFLLEIGTEELPPADVVDAIAQLKIAVPKLLADLRLEHGEIFVSGTPRRLAVLVDGVAARQANEESLVKGPPADRAFDADGAATSAAVGFARKNGVSVDALEVREEGAARYVYAVVRRAGRPATEVLAEALPGLVAGLRFGKTMRWNASGVAFSRPVRWLVALLGDVSPALRLCRADRLTARRSARVRPVRRRSLYPTLQVIGL